MFSGTGLLLMEPELSVTAAETSLAIL